MKTRSNASTPEDAEVCCLWNERRAALGRLCLRWTRGNSSEAEDLLADAFLRFLEERRREGRAVKNLHAWLATIIANLARDRLRRQRKAVPVGIVDVNDVPTLPCHERVVMARRTLAHLQGVPSVMSPSQREALLLKGLGEGYDEIAHVLGTTKANARKLVQLARGKARSRAHCKS